jgi:hypothetical protein
MMTVDELHEELDRREADIGRSYVLLAGSGNVEARDRLWDEEKFLDDIRDVLAELEERRDERKDSREQLQLGATA